MRVINPWLLFLALITFSVHSQETNPFDGEEFLVDMNGEEVLNLTRHFLLNYFSEVKELPLAPFERKDGDVTVKVKKGSVSLALADIEPIFLHGAIDLHIKTKNLKIRLIEMDVKKKIWPGSIESTCFDTSIDIAERVNAPFDGQLEVNVVNNKIKIGTRSINFQIGENNYKVSGPDRCVGSIADSIVQSEVKKALIKMQQEMENTIKSEIQNAISKIELLINQYADLNLPLDFANLPGFPPLHFNLHASPKRINLAPNLAVLAFNVQVTNQKAPTQDRPFVPILTLLNFSLHKNLVNNLLNVIRDQVHHLRLSNQLIPGIENHFRRTNLENTIYDLKFLASSIDHLDAYYDFGKLDIDSWSKEMGIKLKQESPELLFRLANVNYLGLKAPGFLHLLPEFKNKKINLHLISQQNSPLQTTWYQTPQDPNLNGENINALYQKIFSEWRKSGPIFSIDIPRVQGYPRDEWNLVFQGFTFQADYMKCKLTWERVN